MSQHANGGASQPLSDDLIQGARPIGEFIYGLGNDDKEVEANARRIYHLKDKFSAPIFMLGGVISARKSTLLRWIEEQESAALRQGRTQG